MIRIIDRFIYVYNTFHEFILVQIRVGLRSVTHHACTSLTYIILIELSAGYPVAVQPVRVSLAG